MIDLFVYNGWELSGGIVGNGSEHPLVSYDFNHVVNGYGYGSFTIPTTHDAVGWLEDNGCYVRVVHYRTDQQTGLRGPATELFTARVIRRDFPFGDDESGVRTYGIRAHASMLDDVEAFVNPEGNILPTSLSDTAQTRVMGATTPGTVTNLSGHFEWSGATAEAVVKNIIGRNLTRLGIPHVIAPNLGRGGAPILPTVRNNKLSEVVYPVLEAAGLRIDIRVLEGDDHFTVDVAEVADYPQLLTTDGPIEPGGMASIEAPTVTRGLIGGPGEDAARAFDYAIDAALEAEWGWISEGYRDATGFSLKWPDELDSKYRVPMWFRVRPDVEQSEKDAMTRYFQDAKTALLADGQALSTLEVKLREDSDFQFPSFLPGDRLRMQAHRDVGPVFHDRIQKVQFSKPQDGDEIVTPVLGAAVQSTDQKQMARLAAVAAAVRRLQKEK